MSNAAITSKDTGNMPIESPGTGSGPSQSSASPLSDRRGGADPTPLGAGPIGEKNPTNSNASRDMGGR